MLYMWIEIFMKEIAVSVDKGNGFGSGGDEVGRQRGGRREW